MVALMSKSSYGLDCISRRLRVVRALVGMDSRKSFSLASSIPLPTLESWEKEDGNLSKKGAKRLTSALSEMGVVCTEAWLLHGTGEAPKFIASNSRAECHLIKNLPVGVELPKSIVEEVSAFLTHNHMSVVAFVNDDGMEPFFSYGDIVGGVFTDRCDDSIFNKNIILNRDDRLASVRQIIPGMKRGTFAVTCLNLKTSAPCITEYNIDAKSIAQIIWHRRPSVW